MGKLQLLYTFPYSYVVGPLLPLVQSQSLEWTRRSFEYSLAEFYTILLEKHPQVTSEMLEMECVPHYSLKN
jgi:hypothetical protein